MTLYGACFEPGHTYTFVEGVRQWHAALKDSLFSPQLRVRAAVGLARLVRAWNSGVSPFGSVQLHCDVLPQQFGVDSAFRVKLLDVEGLRTLPHNGSAFFADARCKSDAECRRPGCYKGASLAWHYRENEARRKALDDGRPIDETRCGDNGRCLGMGVEYNVYSICRFLLQDLIAPQRMPTRAAADAAEGVLQHCLRPLREQRATADQLVDELQRLAGLLR